MTSLLFDKIFGDLIPAGTNLNEPNVMINCIFHQDENASLSISTDENKPVYNCFGCHAKGSWIGFYMKRNNLTYPEALKALEIDNKEQQKPVKQIIVKEKPVKPLTDYGDYCYKVWNDTIMHDKFFEFYCKKLYELRGITLPTAVACMIGYDPDKGWIFPCIDYKTNMTVGYEIRQKYFKHFTFKDGKETKCYKAKNTPSCICKIFESWENKKAIFCEGFVDAYFMYQYQLEKAQKEKGEMAQVDCTILACSCGVAHVPDLVEEAKLWEDFDEVIFCLDNDEAGNTSTKQLMDLPHNDRFKFFNALNENEDFEEYYKRVLKKELFK